MIELDLTGVAELDQTLRRVEDVLNSDVLFRVYNTGANQGYGRYERYVQGAGWQAWMHRGRWMTDQQIADKFGPDVRDLISVAVDVILAGGQTWRPYIRQAMQLIEKRFKDYPPERPGQRYVRTFTLRNAWQSELKV